MMFVFCRKRPIEFARPRVISGFIWVRGGVSFGLEVGTYFAPCLRKCAKHDLHWTRLGSRAERPNDCPLAANLGRLETAHNERARETFADEAGYLMAVP